MTMCGQQIRFDYYVEINYARNSEAELQGHIFCFVLRSTLCMQLCMQFSQILEYFQHTNQWSTVHRQPNKIVA